MGFKGVFMVMLRMTMMSKCGPDDKWNLQGIASSLELERSLVIGHFKQNHKFVS